MLSSFKFCEDFVAQASCLLSLSRRGRGSLRYEYLEVIGICFEYVKSNASVQEHLSPAVSSNSSENIQVEL